MIEDLTRQRERQTSLMCIKLFVNFFAIPVQLLCEMDKFYV